MNKTKYNLRHVSCSMADFHADRHRFRFEYNGKEYIASCYGEVDIFFNEDKTKKEISEDFFPEDVLCEIQEIIWNKIDKEKKKWRYPKEAYDIADAYCKE